jgi:hypothetical protein
MNRIKKKYFSYPVHPVIFFRIRLGSASSQRLVLQPPSFSLKAPVNKQKETIQSSRAREGGAPFRGAPREREPDAATTKPNCSTGEAGLYSVHPFAEHTIWRSRR